MKYINIIFLFITLLSAQTVKNEEIQQSKKKIKFYIGYSIPTGDFINNIGTKNGINLGVDYRIGIDNNLFVLFTGNYAVFNYNDLKPNSIISKIDKSTSWKFINIMGGFGIKSCENYPVYFYGAAQAGIVLSSGGTLKGNFKNPYYIPDGEWDGTEAGYLIPESKPAFVYSFSGGVVLFKNLDINLKYIISSPEYILNRVLDKNGERISDKGQNYFSITLGIWL